MSGFLRFLQSLEPYSIIPMMALFIIIVLRAYSPRRKKELEQQGRIPLQDEQ